MTRHLRPVERLSPADQLEALARRPLQPRRDVLLMLAARLRALEALDRDEVLDREGHHGADQLALDLESGRAS